MANTPTKKLFPATKEEQLLALLDSGDVDALRACLQTSGEQPNENLNSALLTKALGCAPYPCVEALWEAGCRIQPHLARNRQRFYRNMLTRMVRHGVVDDARVAFLADHCAENDAELRRWLTHGLFRAAAACDMDGVQVLLRHGADIHAVDGRQSILTYVVRAGIPREGAPVDDLCTMLRFLAGKGADIRPHAFGISPVMVAALHSLRGENCKQVLQVLQTLHGLGAEIGQKTFWGETPMRAALLRENLPAVLWLREHGAEESPEESAAVEKLIAKANGQGTPVAESAGDYALDSLLQAIRQGDAAAVRSGFRSEMMHNLVHGATIKSMFHRNARCEGTLLHWAARHNQPGVCEMLLSLGYNADEQDSEGKTPLLWCRYAITGDAERSETLKVLIRHGADVAMRFHNNLGILHNFPYHEGKWSRTEMKLLIQAGADVNAENNAGVTPLLQYLQHGDAERARLLHISGANILHGTKKGFNGLMSASLGSLPEFIQCACDAGADINAVTNKGDTALIYACRGVGKQASSCCKLLLERGASVTPRSYLMQETALHVAASNGLTDIVKMLLDKGANIEMKDCDGCTALMRAVYYCFPETIRLLLERGASMNARNNLGLTVRDYMAHYLDGKL